MFETIYYNIVNNDFENLNEKNRDVIDKSIRFLFSKVDEEVFIPALQQGLKLMKTGETIKFIIPSFNAYDVVGDENKIGINKSIISIVTLINIK